jgi:hypothetical protein
VVAHHDSFPFHSCFCLSCLCDIVLNNIICNLELVFNAMYTTVLPRDDILPFILVNQFYSRQLDLVNGYGISVS